MSRHIELHTVDTDADETRVDDAGLETADGDDVCEHCESQIGHGRGRFAPYVVVLDDEDVWFVCSSCADPVTEPAGLL